MKSPSQHNFALVPHVNIQRSSFNRQSGVKTTFDVDYLVPIYWDLYLPGDTEKLKMHGFGRLATPLKPFMDNLSLSTFFFAIPIRLVWDNFVKMMGEQINPGDSIDYLIPQIVSPVGGWAVQSLQDYLTMPTVGQVDPAATISSSALWTRAYNLVWNQWFRDQNLQNSLTVDKGDGPDSAANYVLQKISKKHDYFTSGLPFAQKGNPVALPFTGNPPIKTNASALVTGAQSPLVFSNSSDGSALSGSAIGAGFTSGQMYRSTAAGPTYGGAVYPNNLYADMTGVSLTTINAIRSAVTIQQFLETDARGGTRYTEVVKAHFNVTSPDARLQRSEYLGGGKTYININPIAQTSAAAAQPTPQGNLAAMGTAHVNGHGFIKSFTEHTIVIGLACVTGAISYQQGLHRLLSARTRYDLWWPDFANIGEQAVLSKEIYCNGLAADNDVLCYQERGAEYRYKQPMITGKYRSTVTTPLDMWHLAEKFATRPTFSSTFIQANTPIDRVVAVPSEPDILFDALFELTTARPMPMYSVPGLLRF